MRSDNELQQLRDTLNDIQSELIVQQKQYDKLVASLKSLKQRLIFFEQLVFTDYLSLLEQLKQKTSSEKHNTRIN